MANKSDGLPSLLIAGIKILLILAITARIFLCDYFTRSENRREHVEELFHCTIDEDYKGIYAYADGFTDMDYLWVFEGTGEPVEFLRSVRLLSSTENPEEAENHTVRNLGLEEFYPDLSREFMWLEVDVYDRGEIIYVPHEHRIYFYAFTW